MEIYLPSIETLWRLICKRLIIYMKKFNVLKKVIFLPAAIHIVKMPQSGQGSMQGSSSTKSLPLKVVFHRMLSSTKGHLPLKVVLHQWLSSTKGCLPLNVVFLWRSSFAEGNPPAKVTSHWRSFSTEGHLPPKVVFHRRLCSTYHSTLVDLIFGISVIIKNLRLLPCLKVA